MAAIQPSPTQQDLAPTSLERSNSERIASIEATLPHLATKTDIAVTRADIEKLKADLTWRIIIAMSILTTIFVAVVLIAFQSTAA